jgi:hypothetical protein
MATERQIAANRRNAALSTGPKTEAGKAQSRLNSTRHGMAGESAEVAAGLSSEFEDRRAAWAAEQQPVGEAGNWALDRVVAATFRIENCEQTIDKLTTSIQERARLAWDQDRALEAATVFGRLDRDPVLASRQLQTNLAGVMLLIEAWLGLVATLETGTNWSESEASRALDLLGFATDLRSGRTLIDAPKDADPVAFRATLALEEIERLEQLRDESMIPLDDLERRQAMAGHVVLTSKPAKLVLRYEREAWKHYRESMKVVQLSTQVQDAAPAPPPVVAPPPRAVGPSPAVAQPSPTIKAEASPTRLAVNNQPGSMGRVDSHRNEANLTGSRSMVLDGLPAGK